MQDTEKILDLQLQISLLQAQLANLTNQKNTSVLVDFSKYKVVSFDLFDTLILRPFAKPSDLFEWLWGKQLKDVRVQSEIAVKRALRREVKLSEIYSKISSNTISPNDEIAAELECVIPNPEGVNLFNQALQVGARVIITSDFYMGKSVLAALLEKCGIKGYSNIYSSSDYGKFKATGLFKEVLKAENITPNQIIHIGDNPSTDIEPANRLGIDTYHLRKPIDKFYANNPQYALHIDSLQISHTIGLFANDDKNRSFWNNLGFRTAAFAYSYAYQIFLQAESDGVKNILFIARDCYLVKKYFDRLNVDKKYKTFYVYANRRMAQNGKNYSDYVKSFNLQGKSAIVDNCTTHHSALRVLKIKDAVLYYLFLFREMPGYKSVAFYPNRGFTASSPLDFLETIMTSPELPVVDVEKDAYGLYHPVYDPYPSNEEIKRIDAIKQICDGALDFNPNPSIVFQMDMADLIVRTFFEGFSEEDKRKFSQIKGTVDSMHEKYREIKIGGFSK